MAEHPLRGQAHVRELEGRGIAFPDDDVPPGKQDRRAPGDRFDELRWIYDVVKVVKGPKGVATRLRGLMLDITDLKKGEGAMDRPAERRFPHLHAGEAPAAP